MGLSGPATHAMQRGLLRCRQGVPAQVGVGGPAQHTQSPAHPALVESEARGQMKTLVAVSPCLHAGSHPHDTGARSHPGHVPLHTTRPCPHPPMLARPQAPHWP